MHRLLCLICLSTLPLLAMRCPSKNRAATAACPPDAIQSKIAELKAQPKANPAYEVWSYKYQGQTVYLVSAPCCDNFNTLYDGCMRVMCAPSGGFTGRGDGNCTDFAQQATEPKLVWRDPRK